jgi:hypothetical protein
MGLLDKFLPLTAAALAAWLAAILVRRKLYKQYAFFFAYVLFAIAAAGIRFLSGRYGYRAFFMTYWITEGVYAILALCALYEAFHDVFRIDYEDWPWFKGIFPVAVGVLAAFFVGDALLHPLVQAGTVVTVVISFGRVVNFVKGGLFGLFFVLAVLLAERWQRYPFGIVTGFAVSAAGSAAAYWAVSIFGTKGILFAHYALPMAYILGLLVWIGTCFQPPDREPHWPETGVLEALGTVTEYSRLLKWITGRR